VTANDSKSFDPLAPETARDPHAEYARLRRTCPIAHSDRWGGFWLLTRYDDIVALTKQHELWVNSIQNVVPAVTTTGRRPPLHFDPPEHTQWRKALSGPFKLDAIAQLEARVRQNTVEMLSPLIAKGRTELVAELAGTLPVSNLCAFLNAPAQDAPEKIKALSETFLAAYQRRDAPGLEAASQDLYALAAEILEARKREPLDPGRDVATAILRVQIGGEPAAEALMQGAMRQLLVAGHVAVTMMMSSSAYHLGRDPSLQRLLRSHPDRIEAAVDELLRLYTPNQGFCRASSRENELFGETIPARAPVVLSYPSANRDESKFEHPEQFQFDREPKHIAFGNGVHKCPGELFARLQLRVFIDELLKHTSRLAVAGDPELAAWPEYGFRRLVLDLTAA
jgi:cytochrome P450